MARSSFVAGGRGGNAEPTLLQIALNSICTDLSTLDLDNIDESRDELDKLVLNQVSSTDKLDKPNIYYTMDSRRLASKHKKSQLDR